MHVGGTSLGGYSTFILFFHFARDARPSAAENGGLYNGPAQNLGLAGPNEASRTRTFGQLVIGLGTEYLPNLGILSRILENFCDFWLK